MMLATTGCQHQKSYDVLVTNRLSAPITVWLTESQSPYDKGFASPEELAMTMNLDAPLGGRIIAPGMTGQAKNVASVSRQNRVVLRIYRADHMAMILAMSAANPDRLDVPLTPGTTDLDVVWVEDHMSIQDHLPTSSAPASPPSSSPPK